VLGEALLSGQGGVEPIVLIGPTVMHSCGGWLNQPWSGESYESAQAIFKSRRRGWRRARRRVRVHYEMVISRGEGVGN
jgi:hypothetical protein